ncbi:MAG: phosphoglucosamine mutase, partial [Clostridia bacterium]|nr:phosphoglucosamine mutase [Clostridia bacterium]
MNSTNKKRKYFGTDGFRGKAGDELTAYHAFRIGRFLGAYYSGAHLETRKPSERARIVIGKDTRRSSYMLEYAIAACITSSGADAYMLHVTTTPSVSYAARMDGFD